jgi:hypothetical protein
MEIPEDDLMERLLEMLGEWQVDALVEMIRKQPHWVAVGRDPVEGFVGEAPPERVWRLN